MKYVDLILPLAAPGTYTYEVPTALREHIAEGMRVEAPFGSRRRYSALVYRLHDKEPAKVTPRKITGLIDLEPVVTEKQLRFWDWIADYYHCTPGEVMSAALPSYMQLQSRTLISKGREAAEDSRLNDKEYLVMQALENRDELEVEEIRKILGQKSVLPLIRKMMDRQLIVSREAMEKKYRERTVQAVRLHPKAREDEEYLEEKCAAVEKFERQYEVMMAFLQDSGEKGYITKARLVRLSDAHYSTINSLVKKELLEDFELKVSRTGAWSVSGRYPESFELSEYQLKALGNLKKQLEEKNAVLLHGVTGSGKTQLYMELISEALENGKQVLYLLPEIALTAQLLERLKAVFKNKVVAYHSRIDKNERVEIWKLARTEPMVFLGPRSTIFLPFQDLGLIVADESHDYSYKQQDPAPRYNGRDAAVFLAGLHDACIVLGTATPSMESWYNAINGKYGYVRLEERYGDSSEAGIEFIDMSRQPETKGTPPAVSKSMLEAIENCLSEKEQVILFRNRRGYAPQQKCTACGWQAECVNCDIGLTYHKYSNQLQCHYCGFRTAVKTQCPSCGSKSLALKGAGTEKIEEFLEISFPEARIERMDMDTTRSKKSLHDLLFEFDNGEIDILVGTQMVTKGLDFVNVGLVGVLQADAMLFFPDFRAHERAFQLMVQVAGRAGRVRDTGKVLIQTWQPGHELMQDVQNRNFKRFYGRELYERKQLFYPPFSRIIKIQLRHKKNDILREATAYFDRLIRPYLGNKLRGPAPPPIPRLRGYYLVDFIVKTPRDAASRRKLRYLLDKAVEKVAQQQGMKSVRVVFDVDPY